MSSFIQFYECKRCKQWTKDKKEYLRGFCTLCRLTELKTRYMEEKLQNYNNFELNKEIKLIGWKLLESGNLSDHFSDDVSSIDDPNDNNYAPETPERTGKEKKRISFTQSITSQKSPKESKKVQKRKLSKSRTLPEEPVKKKPKKLSLMNPMIQVMRKMMPQNK